MSESEGFERGSGAQLLDRGRVLLARGAWEEAAERLGEALATAVSEHGDMDAKSAPYYVSYADALFSLAQKEADVFEGPSKSREVEAVEEGEEPEDGPEVEDDEESDLDLAWKMLEIAKIIYEKEGNGSIDDLVDVHLKLAEVSLEREDYDACMEDLDRAIQLLRGKEGSEGRTLASIHFRKAVALQLKGELSEALDSCNTAASIFDSKCVDLKKKIQDSEGASGSREAKTELKDLEAILVEIHGKSEELQDAIKMEERARDALKQAFGLAGPSKPLEAKETAVIESTGFDAPKLTANATSVPVKDLGTVGGGRSRITPVSVNGRTEAVPASFDRDGTEPPVSKAEGKGLGESSALKRPRLDGEGEGVEARK